MPQHQGIVEKEKRKLNELERTVNEIKKQIDKCPESMRETMEEKLFKVSLILVRDENLV